MNEEQRPSGLTEADFDLRVRADMAWTYEPGEIPDRLFKKPRPLLRRAGVQKAIATALLLALGTGTVLAMRPPALVRNAIEHEYYERTLRGSFMDSRQLIAHLGLGDTSVLPGYPQLMRPCDLDGHLAYHLTTFFERGGMVTVFAFDQPVALPLGSGWWKGVHWRSIVSRDGKPLLLIAQKEQALEPATRSLAAPQAPQNRG